MNIDTFFTLTPMDWKQIIELGTAFFLSSLIGFEREIRMKSAGLRTHALVGLAAALLMLVSKYGFMDMLFSDNYRLDPARIAAQIVSGIGFIGGGLIFVRKDIVHGLTTAATVWLTAAVGMACGAGMILLAVITCVGYFIVVFGYTFIMGAFRGYNSRLLIRYRIGHDAAASVLETCEAKEFTVLGFNMGTNVDPETASVELRLRGKGPLSALAHDLEGLPAILSVSINPPIE
ncbi:MAG: hypothetical protein DELT_02919 [Desulfovibrio sp.]